MVLAVQRANVVLDIKNVPEPDAAAREAMELMAEQILLNFVGFPHQSQQT